MGLFDSAFVRVISVGLGDLLDLEVIILFLQTFIVSGWACKVCLIMNVRPTRDVLSLLSESRRTETSADANDGTFAFHGSHEA